MADVEIPEGHAVVKTSGGHARSTYHPTNCRYVDKMRRAVIKPIPLIRDTMPGVELCTACELSR